MALDYSDEEQMLLDLVDRFVDEQLMPLENDVIARVAAGEPSYLPPEDEERLRTMCRELGLWALDAPEEVGGAALPGRVMIGIQERIKRTLVPFQFPPDSPNLHMLMVAGNEDQVVVRLENYGGVVHEHGLAASQLVRIRERESLETGE